MSSANEKRKKDDDGENTPKRLRTTDEPPSKNRCSSSSENNDTMYKSPTASSLRINGGPKAGVVKKIYMKNFMCHSSLEINLHPQINLICGRNGSGKSAILTALVVGLGGKASTTNRGSSLKEFIKKGMNSAVIEVTLNNTGIFRYKPDEYGESIVVTRSLNASTGQTSYKLKSEKGTVISTRKEELDRITSAMNIQVDNPVSVLNQDAAKTFLKASDPHEKYTLFMKATQIEKLENTYAEALAEKHRSVNIINKRKESLDEALKEINDLEKKWNTLQSLDEYRKKAEELENELYWSVVVAEEKVAETIRKKLNEHLKKIPEMQTSVDMELERETEVKKNMREIEEGLKEKRSAITTCEKEYSEFKEEARKRRENYATKMKIYKSLITKSQRLSDNVTTLKQTIENYNSSSSSEQAAKRQQIQQQIKELVERLADVQHTLKTNNQHYKQLSSNIDKISGDYHSLCQEKDEQTCKIDQRQREIRSLKNESHNSLTVFGAWVPRVSQKIDEACKRGMFEVRPRGPLGAYIKLKDASWAAAIEGFLGPLLKSYCVNSSKDSKVLNNIFQDVLGSEKKPNIIISRFVNKVHDVWKYAVQSNEYSSIMDMLIISDPVVCNVLIDQREIETILLIPSGTDASRIMCEASLVPKNCKRAITKKGDQFFPDPNYRTYAGDGNTRAKFLQVSMQDAIRSAEEDLKNRITQRDEIDKQLRVVERRINESRNEMNLVGKKIKELKRGDFSIQSRLTELRDIEEPEPYNVASLVSELKESTDAYEKAKEEESRAEAECQRVKENFEEIEMRLKEKKEKIREIQNEEMPLLNQKVNIQSELKEILSKKKSQEEKYKEICKKVAKVEAELSKQNEKVKKAEADASMICARVETDREPIIVQNQLNKCQRHMENVEKLTGSLEDVGTSFIEKKTKYNQIIGDLKILEDRLNELEVMLEVRKKVVLAIARLASLRVQHMFQSLMHSRKYTGKLKIDHKKKILEMSVSPDLSNEKRITDPKSLSGGERSFSTVAFLMSLWDTVEPPFYFLDEFDVFMDKVNRHFIMDLLLEHARQKPNYEFVFLTPQDTSNIRADTDIRIHRMEDPHRSSN